MSDSLVRGIAIDALDNKWFGTQGGVSKLSQSNTGITTLMDKNKMQIYPNPVKNILYIKYLGETGMSQVFDVTGKCLMQNQIIGNNPSIDVSFLENGIYFYKVMYDKQVVTGKVVKY